ncbi:tRNA (cytosine(38)-C(5))-methyltransferase [Lycorma delicatula]|uniref:tRNA (cytosine(38)-C(5))-methyltransferase n=1 Tax=Lycorma delicatula TaxID=130591 RepID=UPI003F510B3C
MVIMRVLELFSGIGGMHYAMEASGINAEVVAAVDINTVANLVYKHNFPSTKLYQKNIQSFSVEEINKISPDIILMSPPCQPFTRIGLKKDLKDERTCALLYLINILPHLDEKLKYILVENVKGFEKSEAKERLTNCLKNSGFIYQEFILCPTQIGIPNSRSRYYLIAKRLPRKFSFSITTHIVEEFPNELDSTVSKGTYYSIADVIESGDQYGSEYEELLIPDNVLLKRAKLMDIVTKESTRSCCFTKAYGHYIEGTGSVYSPFTQDVISSIKCNETNENEFYEKMKTLKLRYFSPSEIARLMNFPDSFTFPNNLNRKQKYRLLGNSINVKVVSVLIKIMLHNDNI